MKINCINKIYIILILLFSGYGSAILATHIVGGQMTYSCIGNNKYVITLYVQRDCINGADTVYFDNPAEIGVYNAYDRSVAWRVGINGKIDLEFFNDDTINETINSGCVAPGQKVCVHQSVYRKVITLPFSEQGYIIAYQRCCRNTTLSNIIDPLETGTTFAMTISAQDMQLCNSNPVFGPFPPIYTCQDKAFVFDHSAVDIDGDSLVYSLCLPNTGRTRLDPKGFPTVPPYDSVVLKPAYSLNNLLNPNNTGIPLRIDPRTGLLTGTPNTVGQFLVGVCVTEYRNGIKLSYSKREFELNVVPCGIQPIADFEILTGLCNGLNQTFSDHSQNAVSYRWYFDYPNNLNLVSTEKSPSFQFPKDGTYTIMLIVKNGSCEDSLKKTIKIIDPALHAAFKISANCISPLSIILNDSSSARFGIADYNWSLTGMNINLSSKLQNPVFSISKNGVYYCTLIVTDINGCKDTLTKQIELNEINLELVENKIICNGDSVHLVKNPNPNYTYMWSPTNGLNLRNPYDPIASPGSTTTYMVTITNGACSLEKKVTITVKQLISFQVMGDTNSCDGMFSLMASSDSTNIFEWSENPIFNPILIMGNKFVKSYKKNTTIYLRAGTRDQCSEIQKIDLIYNGFDLKYNKTYEYCLKDSILFQINNIDTTNKIAIVWKPDTLILDGQGTFNPKFKFNRPGSTKIFFTARNQFGCLLSDSIMFNISPEIKADLKIDLECGSNLIKVSTNYKGKVRWDFGDGIGNSNKNSDTYTYIKDGKYTVTLIADTLCSLANSQTIFITTNNFEFEDTLRYCPDDIVILNPKPNLKYKYKWSPDSCFVNPNDPNPIPKSNKDMKYFVEFYDPENPACLFKDSICVLFTRDFYLNFLSKDSVLCDPGIIVLRVQSNMKLTWCDRNEKTIGVGDSISINVDRDSLIVVKGNYENCVDRDTMKLNLVEFDSKIIGPNNICPDDTVLLKVNPSDSNWVYDWSPIEDIIGSKVLDSVLVAVKKNTKFVLKIKDNNGCERVLDHQIDVSGLRNVIFATADPSVVTAGEKVQLTTIFNSSYKYKWEPNDGSLNVDTIYNPIAMPQRTTTYTVLVTDENGCTATASVIVKVIPCDESVFLPNAFSPNGDLKNDTFICRGNSLTKIDLVIYNRWGQKVFHTDKLGEGWDGYFNGTKLEPDVFAYYINFQCLDNFAYSKKGNVSLLK